ncbi:MAG TPA: hypothetical protein DCE52_05310 [Rhodobacteraceae bacterium]|nr:hypothetical protein [Paracoccaceae bacterium]
MSINTWYRSGAIDQILDSNAPPHLKLFCAFSYGQPDDVKLVTAELLNASERLPKNERLMLARATLLTAWLYERVDERIHFLLNTIKSNQIVSSSDFGYEVLEGAYQFIHKMYQIDGFNRLALENPSEFAVLGDSHIIGFTHVYKNGRFIYIPGIRLSLLSSPQQNLKLVGLRNFFLHHYTSRNILINVGEIDVRSYFVNGRNSGSDGYEMLTSQTVKAFEAIAEVAGRHQKVTMVVPPCRRLEDPKMWRKYLNYAELFKTEAVLKGFSVIEYPFCSEADLIDHAHFFPDTYQHVLQTYLEII